MSKTYTYKIVTIDKKGVRAEHLFETREDGIRHNQCSLVDCDSKLFFSRNTAYKNFQFVSALTKINKK